MVEAPSKSRVPTSELSVNTLEAIRAASMRQEDEANRLIEDKLSVDIRTKLLNIGIRSGDLAGFCSVLMTCGLKAPAALDTTIGALVIMPLLNSYGDTLGLDSQHTTAYRRVLGIA